MPRTAPSARRLLTIGGFMKTLLRTTANIPWMPTNSEGRLYHTDELPPPELRRTAFALAFSGERILLTNLVKRGWDIPGGHIDPGETPVQTVVRETMEEAGALVEPVELVGVQELEVFGLLPRDGWSGRHSTQVFYLCRVVELLPFTPNSEAVQRDLFAPAQAMALPTMANHDLLFHIALKRVQEGAL
jgi:8-oxo-dGTP pyrophosphatase MutT (NUDIX family)